MFIISEHENNSSAACYSGLNGIRKASNWCTNEFLKHRKKLTTFKNWELLGAIEKTLIAQFDTDSKRWRIK